MRTGQVQIGELRTVQVRTGLNGWGEDRNTHQAVVLPGFGEFGSELFFADQNLHLFKTGMVPELLLEGQLVLWYRVT